MKILVVGSGGREHAICWKIAQSEKISKIYCCPGNGGISDIAECADIKADDIDGLLSFAKQNSIDITIVGPEAPLASGIVDRFKESGLKIFGPCQHTAQLEGSKVFAKDIMAKFNIPTAGFKVFENPDEAKEYIDKRPLPLVIKADGLCAGKGVIIVFSKEDAYSTVDSIMVKREFKSAGARIIIEDCLIGEEVSVILISDGNNYVCLSHSQDHKRAFDNDEGPNTGGMGAYSPAPVVTPDIEKDINRRIIAPLIKGLAKEGAPYKGVLYIGLMIVKDKPYVLEFNVRFGDPETQAILPRLKTDLLDIVKASIDGNISDVRTEWESRACVCVVCASGGYPGNYKKGMPIGGLDKVRQMKDVVVFHAGTKHDARSMIYETNGGRVLGVTALGDDIKQALDKAYMACSKIKFEGIHYRKDIGYRALLK